MSNAILFYYSSLLIFIACAVLCAVIRHAHVCVPYQNDADYYFPARKITTAQYAYVILLIASVFRPTGNDAYLFARCFLAIYMPLRFAFMNVFFFKTKCSRKFETQESHIHFYIILACAILVLIDKDILSSHKTAFLILTWVIFIYGNIRLFISVKESTAKAIAVTEETISNSDDYPVVFAKHVVFAYISSEIPCLISLAIGTPVALGISFLLMAAGGIQLLLNLLNTQMPLKFKIVPFKDADSEKEAINDTVFSPCCGSNPSVADDEHAEQINALAKKIASIMESEELFKESHLTINDLAEKVEAHPLDVREACKLTSKNFFDFVNSYRMEFSKRYSAEHPEATRSEVAILSGFGSYRSFLRTEARLAESKKYASS